MTTRLPGQWQAMADGLPADFYDEMARRIQQSKDIVPPVSCIFRAFELTPPEAVRVVIVGQDPYPTPGHANGLAFSVNSNIKKLPPSLKNIFKRLVECGHLSAPPMHGDLTSWATQGVLLINRSLTSQMKQPQAHRTWKWYRLTESLIANLTMKHKHLVFLLWGREAHQVEQLIHSGGDHYVVKSSHPSPLGFSQPCQGHPAFREVDPFTLANQFLEKKKLPKINWGSLLEGEN